MNRHDPIKMPEAQVRSERSSKLTRKNILISVMSVLIVLVMSAWLGFLGWGLLETARAAEKFIATFF
jgi:hypothetical protein